MIPGVRGNALAQTLWNLLLLGTPASIPNAGSIRVVLPVIGCADNLMQCEEIIFCWHLHPRTHFGEQLLAQILNLSLIIFELQFYL